jgi:DNA end-binding protein Ku
MLELMHFAHEVLEPEALKTPSEKDVSPRELDMAKALIESMTAEWEPAKYKDQYRAAVMELIEEKARNRQPSGKPVEPRMASKVVDMVAVLKKNMKKVGKGKTQQKGSDRVRSTTSLLKQKRRSAAA